MMPRTPIAKERVSHADDWLITYADMITLLLCFFVIFLMVSVAGKGTPPKAPVAQAPVKTEPLPPPVQHRQLSPEAILAPAQIPDVLGLAFHEIGPADFPLQTDNADEALPPVIIPPVIVPSIIPPVIIPPLVAPPVVVAVPPANDDEAPAPVSTSAASPPEIAGHLKSQGIADTEQKGDRIKTFEVSSAAFFDSGSATLSDAGKSILQDAAINLKSDQFKNYRITVEGYTDDTPIHTAQFPSNWELSTARAAAVVHYFLDQGIPAERLRAAGYADTFPKVPNRDANGNPIPENQARNRRVVIRLEKIEKDGAATKDTGTDKLPTMP